jgi:hypothetical protein
VFQEQAMQKSIIRALMVALTGAAGLVAQTNAGTITGTVFDQQKAVISGAKITAVNVNTGVSQTAVTSSAGSYTIPSLAPGVYRVSADAPGFSSVTQTVEVATSRTVTLDLTLSVGQTATAVVVTAETTLLQQANAAIQYTISPKQIDELPIPNQSVLRALEMIPGVVGEAGTEQTAPTMGFTMPGATLSVGGGRMGATQYKADGVDNTSTYFGSIAQSFSSDAVQEVQVQMNSFSAEFGRVGAGVVNMTTKSGTNELHGVASSYIQNDALNAAPYTNTWRFKGIQRYWRGAGNLGGPIVLPKIYNGRNRSFFFFDFEPLRQATSTTWYENTPTEQERNGDFSGMVYNRRDMVPITIFRQWEYNPAGTGLTNTRMVMPAGEPYPVFPGNRIPPSLISPLGKKLINLFPKPNYVNPDPASTVNYVAPMSVNNIENRYLVKYDQVVGSANRFSFRFSTAPAHGKRFYFGGKDSLVDMNATDNRIGTGVVFNDRHVWGGNKVNEFRLGFNRAINERVAPAIQNSKNWFKEFGLPSRLEKGMPRFNFTGAAAPVAGTGTTRIDNVFQLNNIFNWIHGRHAMKLGFEFQSPQQNLIDLNPIQGSWSFSSSYTDIGSSVLGEYYAALGLPVGAATGRGAATLLLGFPSGVTIAPSVIPYQYRWKYYAGFLQDDFKVTPRLTLNMGVRYQVEVPRKEKHHNQGNFVDDFATDSLGQRVRGYVQLSGLGKGPETLFPTRYNNIEPRFGFAYRLERLGWLKVVRGGYGISHTPTNGLFSSPYPDLNPRSDQLAANGGLNWGAGSD